MSETQTLSRAVPLRPAPLAPQAAACLNAVPPCPAEGWPVQIGTEGYRLRLRAPVETAAWAAALHFAWGETPGVLFLSADGCADWLAGLAGADLTASTWNALPAGLRLAAVESVLSPLLERIAKCGGLPLSLREISLETKTAYPESAQLFWTLTRERDGLALTCAVSLQSYPQAVCEAFVKLVQTLPAGETEVEDVPVTVAVEIGTTSITAVEAEGLAAGDIVLLQNFYPLQGDRVKVVSGRTAWNAVWKSAGQIVIQGSLMPETEQQTAASDNVNVTLTLEVDSRLIPLSQLKAFAEGHILETDKTPQSPVAIKAGGKTVGMGELVDLGGRVGVRITKLG